jgi:uncharacterized lipoprotein YehR (DUF1307 family)
MKKVLSTLALVLAAILVLSLAGCGSASAKTLDLTAFADDVLDTVTYDDELIELSDKVAGNYYDLTFDGLEDWKIYVSATSSTTNELAVFSCKDSTALDAAKQSVENRLAKQRDAYELYIPDELLRLDNALIKTSGNYLLFSVSDDNETVESLFDKALK